MPTIITRGAASARGFGFVENTKLGPIPDSALNISQFTYVNYLELTPSFITAIVAGGNPYVFTMSEDGKYFYINDYGSDDVYQFTLVTPYDITTATTAGYKVGYIGVSQTNGHMGMTWKPDGTAFVIGNYNSGPMVKYNVATPWMVDTITSSQSGNSPAGNASAYTRVISSDGQRMLLQQGNTNLTRQYEISTPWNMTTLISTSTYQTTVTGSASDMFQASFSNEGQYFFVIDSGDTPRKLRQYPSVSGSPFNIPSGGTTSASFFLNLPEIDAVTSAPRLTEFVLVGGQRYLYIMQQRGGTSTRQIFCYAKLT